MTIGFDLGRVMAITPIERMKVLARFAHGLTIGARVFLADADVGRSKEMNEILHRVLGALLHISENFNDFDWPATAVRNAFGSKDPAIALQVEQAWKLAVEGLLD